MSATKPILITGGAGYIGSGLTRRLLEAGKSVRVLDALIFGNGLSGIESPNLDVMEGDIRDEAAYARAVQGCEIVVHLAAVANDPSVDLDPALGKSVNLDCLPSIMRVAKDSGVRRFIYASSASVYGVSDSPQVDEEHKLVPITDYNRFKAEGENILNALRDETFETISVRAATVCGPSARQRLDLTVNMLTAQGMRDNVITVFGGDQYRPNVHVADLVEVYSRLVTVDELGEHSGTAINVGNENLKVSKIADLVREVLHREHGIEVSIETTASDDVRSYRLHSPRVARVTEFQPERTVETAVSEVARAIIDGAIPAPLDDPRYYNVRWMKRSTSPASA